MKIGFFCYSPASINSAKAMIDANQNKEIEIFVFCPSEESLELFIKQEVKNTYTIVFDFKIFVDCINVLFYGTGSGSEIELELLENVRKINTYVITVAIQDIFWEQKDGFLKRYQCIPDYIIVNTAAEANYARKYLGMTQSQILIYGNPYFDRLKNIKLSNTYKEKSVSFISQCEGNGGYEEDTKFECKEAILELLILQQKGIISDLNIYKHPRESARFYERMGIPYMPNNTFEEMMNSEYIISAGSTPHYEAMLIGKKNIFVPNEHLKEAIETYKEEKTAIDFEFNACEKIYKHIENIQRKK